MKTRAFSVCKVNPVIVYFRDSKTNMSIGSSGSEKDDGIFRIRNTRFESFIERKLNALFDASDFDCAEKWYVTLLLRFLHPREILRRSGPFVFPPLNRNPHART